MKQVMVERFWSRVVKGEHPDTCWTWQGGKTTQGYGELMVDGRMWYAHRLSLHLAGVQLPQDKVVDHKCRNRACVRPDHLELVTNRTNILRGVGAAAVNALKTHCPKNHPYDAVNTWVNKDGERFCRECRREYDRRARSRSRAAGARKAAVGAVHVGVA